MTITSYKELLAKIKSKELDSFYLFYGSNAELKRKGFSILKDALSPKEFADFNELIFNGRGNANSDEKLSYLGSGAVSKIEEAIDNPPYFSERKLVVLDDFDFSGVDEREADRLLEAIKNKPEETDLIVYLDEETSKKLSQKEYKALVSLAKKQGTEIFISEVSEREIASEIKKLGKKYNSSMPQGIISDIISYNEGDYLSSMQEAEKLFSYARDREVTSSDEEKLLIIPIYASAFDIIKCLADRNASRCQKIISDLFYLREPGLKILGAIEMGFLDVYKAKLGIKNGRTKQEIAEDFGYKKMFRLEKAIGLSRSFTIEKLKIIIKLLAKADLQLKSTQIDETIILEKLITEIIMIKE